VFLIFFASIAIKTFSCPVWGYDAYAIWLARAKAFFIDQGITVKNLKYFWPAEHPLMWSTTAYWLFVFLNKADFLIVRILPLFFYCLIIFSFWRQIRGNKLLKLVFALFLMTIPQLIDNVTNSLIAGNADLFTAFYIFLAILSLINSRYAKAGLFLALGSLIKSDATPMILLFVISYLFLVNKKRIKPIVLAILPVVLLFVSKKMLGIGSRYLGFQSLNFTFPYVFYDLMAFREEFRNIAYWNLLWWLYFFSLIACFKTIIKKKNYLFANLLVIFQLGVYFFIFLITPEDQAGHIASALFRLLLQLAPAVLFLTFIQVKELMNNIEE
jgi:hypothetical protein